MSDLKLIIRTADKAHKAEVTVEDTQTCGDMIQASLGEWALPKEADYKILNVSKTPPQILNPSSTLAIAGVVDGETLEIQPVLVAGNQSL